MNAPRFNGSARVFGLALCATLPFSACTGNLTDRPDLLNFDVWTRAGTYLVAGESATNDGVSPIARIAVSTTLGPAPLDVAFDARESNGQQGGLVAVAWDFGDGNVSTEVAPSYTFATPGAYVVQLTVTDVNGHTGTATATILALPPFTIECTPDVWIGTAPVTTTFRPQPAAALPELPAGFRYLWDLGDGGEREGNAVKYTYRRAGVYTITLNVTDALCAYTCASRSVAVLSAAVPQEPAVDDPNDGGPPPDPAENPTVNPDLDVQDVRFRGDCTIYGMRVVTVGCSELGFVVQTTGARFEYLPGEIRTYQGLDANKRLLTTVALPGAPVFELAEYTLDHALFYSEAVDLGIYGDSTLIVTPKSDLRLTAHGAFQADYEGRVEGELLLIDSGGGVALYPQRHESGYTVHEITLKRPDWVADYTLQTGNRMMIAAFPGRPFDWEKSFRTHSIIVYGSMGLGIGNPYGEMPPDTVIAEIADHFDIALTWHWGLYQDGSWMPPWDVVNEPEFERYVATAQSHGLKVAPYTSLFYYTCKYGESEGYVDAVAALVDQYGVEGVYVDGTLFDSGGRRFDDKITSWETIRRLRQLFGADGAIVFHGTQEGLPTATMPNVDTYCDATLMGEGVEFESVDDPYVQFQVRKYGISNTVGHWVDDKRPESISWQEAIDAIMRMNGRHHSYSYVSVFEPPPDNTYVWGNGLTIYHRYYLEQLEDLEEAYLAGEVPPFP